MSLRSVRWQNFRSFRDSGWLNLRPITVFLGANASGKTSLLAPLLLLKQTDESRDPGLALKTKGRFLNAGSFEDLIHCHDSKLMLQLSLRFGEVTPGSSSELPLGGDPPAELSLTFSQTAEESLVLQGYLVMDTVGRTMLERDRLEDGRYSLKGIAVPDDKTGIARLIRRAKPEGFLFTPDQVLTQLYERMRRQAAKGQRGKGVSLRISNKQNLYFSILAKTRSEISEILTDLTYLGPLRERPKRIYEASGEIPFSVGPHGQYAPEILYSSADDSLHNHVNYWLNEFQFGRRLECHELSHGVFTLLLHREKPAARVNAADTGFGLSQVLPLIVQGFYGAPGDMLVVEQPEIHLNPRLQTKLGDLFSAFAAHGVTTIIETHSEHLILRLRRLIAEGTLSADDVALYFTDRRGNESSVRSITIDDFGRIPEDEWPKGFFEESLAESLALANAQMERAGYAQ